MRLPYKATELNQVKTVYQVKARARDKGTRAEQRERKGEGGKVCECEGGREGRSEASCQGECRTWQEVCGLTDVFVGVNTL